MPGQRRAATMGGRGARAGRPQPQTTGSGREGGGGRSAPFERFSRRSERPGYSVTGVAYGGAVDQPLNAAPGYLRYLDISLNATGGANATTNTVAIGTTGSASDFGSAGFTTSATSGPGTSPAAAISFIQVKDAYGTPIISGPGYEILHLVPMFSGQVGVSIAADTMKWPTVSTAGLGTGTATSVTGNFFLHSRIPFEIVPGYGCLAVGNASLQPALHIQFNGSGTIYTTAPSTAPTFAVTVDEAYWAVPVDEARREPPGLGTTLQWTVLTANPTVGTGSSGRVQFPRTGGYLTTLILVARNAAGQRMDTIYPALGSNNRIRLYLDGVPVLDESIEERIDLMFNDFGGGLGSALFAASPGGTGLRPAGVLAYSFKTSESQMNLGQLDNGNLWVSSTPGTLIEVECTPWGTFAGGPATLTAIVGQIVPRGPVVQGLEILG